MERVTAFNQNFRSIKALAKDPRCVVPYRVLWTRIRGYGWNPDDAVSLVGKHPRYRVWGEGYYTMRDIVADERCEVDISTLRRRVYRGIPLDQAIQTLLPDIEFITLWDEEFLRLSDIAKDERCGVNYRTLVARVKLDIPMSVAVLSHDQYIAWRRHAN